MISNNRRYGGYVVHAGMAFLAIGIVSSSMYRETRELRMGDGEKVRIGPYELDVRGLRKDQPVSAYFSTSLHVDIHRDGRKVGALEPEKRLYPRQGTRMEQQTTTEVSIARMAGEDLYIYFDRLSEEGRYVLTVFRNPFMRLIFLGWWTMLAGGILCALPLGKRKVGLAG